MDEKAMMEIAAALGDTTEITGAKTDNGRKNLYSVSTSHAEGSAEDCNAGDPAGATFEQFAFSAGMVAGEGAESTKDGSLWMEQCQCQPRDEEDPDGSHNNNGSPCSYPSQQTSRYDGASLRAFVARVVTPPLLSPVAVHDENPAPAWDTADALPFAPTPRGARLRLALLAAELVEPYTAIRSVAGIALRDDVVPASPRPPGACRETRTITMPETAAQMKATVVEWTVGGALEVDETAIMYGKWEVLDGKVFDCVTQPTKQELDAFFTILRDFEIMGGETTEEMAEDVNFSPVQHGVTRWHRSASSFGMHDGAAGAATSPTALLPETTFSVSLDLHHYKAGDVIAVYSLARTDQGWAFGGGTNGGDGRAAAAQSHIVNARTNPQWFHDHGDAVVRGRIDWFSVPVTIKIGPQPGFFEGNGPVETSVRVTDEGLANKSSVGVIRALMLAVAVMAVTMCCVFCREERDGTDIFSIWSEHRRISKQKISLDQFFSEEAMELSTLH